MADTAVSVSVVIATRGRPQTLRRAVESLTAQGVSQVVVSAYAGDPSTLAIANELAHRRSPTTVTLLTDPLDSMPSMTNRGIRAATGDVIAFMDDDAEAGEGWLGRLTEHYSDDSVGAVGGRDVIWIDGAIYAVRSARVGHLTWFGRLLGNHHNEVQGGARDVHFLKGCNMSFRRDVLVPIDSALIGKIPYGFEIDMGLSARSTGRRVVYDPALQVDHYPTSYMGADDQALARVLSFNQTYILLKHLSGPQIAAFLVYTFVVGDANTPGLVRFFTLAPSWRANVRLMQAHLAAKVGAIRAFASRRRVPGDLLSSGSRAR